MAQRQSAPIDFSNIAYIDTNIDRRWHLQIGDPLTAGEITLTDAQKATVITRLFQASGAAGLNIQPFGNPLVANATHGIVTVAVRIPQTRRLLDLVLNRSSGSDSTSLFENKALEYTIEVSGRSDKKFSEIIDWVKVADQTGQIQEGDGITDVYLPRPDAVYNQNDTDRFHARMFPYYTSWVKITFYNVQTRSNSPDLFLDKIDLHVFNEDLKEDEQAPTAEVVFPRPGTPWLPSQTIYFTTRVYEPDTDAVHVRYEIYKETTGNTTLSGDTLMYTVESNALNLDGTPNENYSHSWIGLPIRTVSYTHQIYLPGYVNKLGTNPGSVLIVPIDSATGPGGVVSLKNVKFYDNQGNILKFDAEANAITFPNITVPTVEGRANATGWLINFPSALKFNRIDFVSPATGSAPTKVDVYYNTSTAIASDDKVLVSGVWNNSSLAGNFRGPNFVANIEFCWPDVDVAGTFDPADEGIVGYREGLLGAGEEVDNDPDSYNPDRNGIGITETNAGDWSKIHPFAGIMVGPAYTDVVSSTNTYTHSAELGDSPVPVSAASAGLATNLATGGNGIVTRVGIPGATAPLNVDAVSRSVADRIVYVRLAMPDPYLDGDRFYAKCLVWDGRTQIV